MKKILVLGMTDNIGGIETFYMTYYREIIKKGYVIDFATVFKNMAFEDEIRKNGGTIYILPNFKKNTIGYKRKLSEIIENNKYDVVHYNMLSAANIIPLKIAKKLGVKNIIAHSHNTNIPNILIKRILHNYNKNKIKKYANNLIACSKDAGKWMFNNEKFTILNNAIECQKFYFNHDVRTKLRKKYNITDKQVVIGHIGKMCEQKNHKFLIDVFKEICDSYENYKLILVGVGELENDIRFQVKKNKLEDKVIFLGRRTDVNDVMNMFDIFVLPSLFEGLGIVLVEAQANGLKCFASNIPDEVMINANIEKLDLNIIEWKNKITQTKNNNRIKKLSKSIEEYDINLQKKKLENI